MGSHHFISSRCIERPPRKHNSWRGRTILRYIRRVGKQHNLKEEKTRMQSHNSLGIGERYHKPLGDTYEKLKTDFPSVQRRILFPMAAKAMNNVLGPEENVPSGSIFGNFHASARLPTLLFFVQPLLNRLNPLSEHFEIFTSIRHKQKYCVRRSTVRSQHQQILPTGR